MPRQLLTLGLALGTCVALMAAPATAQTSNGAFWAEPLPSSDGAGIGVGSIVRSGGEQGGGGRSCTYRHDPALTVEAGERFGYEGGGVFWYECDDGDFGFRWIPQAEPVDPAALARQAAQYLRLPAPGIGLNPPPDRDQIVNLETWLWVEPGSWEPQSATASVPGVSATVTAEPVSVRWDMGDGRTVVCEGPGRQYDPSRPASAQRTDCSHTFRRSSARQPGGRYVVSATLTWRVAWTSTIGAGGTLPAEARTAQVPLRVAEVQALN